MAEYYLTINLNHELLQMSRPRVEICLCKYHDGHCEPDVHAAKKLGRDVIAFSTSPRCPQNQTLTIQIYKVPKNGASHISQDLTDITMQGTTQLQAPS